jgi:hypothetical protein
LILKIGQKRNKGTGVRKEGETTVEKRLVKKRIEIIRPKLRLTGGAKIGARSAATVAGTGKKEI